MTSRRSPSKRELNLGSDSDSGSLVDASTILDSKKTRRGNKKILHSLPPVLILAGLLMTFQRFQSPKSSLSSAWSDHWVSSSTQGIFVSLRGQSSKPSSNREVSPFLPKPRIVLDVFLNDEETSNTNNNNYHRFSANLNTLDEIGFHKIRIPHGNREVRPMGRGERQQKIIRDRTKDGHGNNGYADPIDDGCEVQYDWQRKSFPNCNLLHEQDLEAKLETPAIDKDRKGRPRQQASFITRGGYRLVWFLQHIVGSQPQPQQLVPENFALKTFRWDEYDWDERQFDRHRRDALMSDRLTASPHALHQFAFCGNSGIYEFADGGSLEDQILDDEGELREEFHSWTPSYKLSLAYQVASGVADIHNMDQEGRASMSHTDIAARQFISVDGGKSFKINDFNRARFLYRNISHPELNCPFFVGSNTGRFRAPEEYAYEPETEKIDVYSMGNILYQILTGLYPFKDYHRKDMYKAIQEGVRPVIPDKYLKSTDPKVQAMVKAIQDCWIGDPVQRASARSVEQLLKKHLES